MTSHRGRAEDITEAYYRGPLAVVERPGPKNVGFLVN